MDPPDVWSAACCLVVSATFGIAGVGKLRRGLTFRATLADLVRGRLVRPVAVAVPIIELLIAALLVAGFAPRLIAGLAIAALAAFSAALWRMKRVDSWSQCACFGEDGDGSSLDVGLVRNALLTLCAALIVVRPGGLQSVAGFEDGVLVVVTATGAIGTWLVVKAVVVNAPLLFKRLGEA
jgi:putative oxidoreductase